MMSEEPISALQPGSDAKSAPANLTGTGNIAETSAPQIPDVLSILPMRSFTVFPGTILPLTVGRAASIKLLDETLPQTKIIGLLTQRDETKEDPQAQDLYPVGTAAIVLKLLRQSDNHVVVAGRSRFAQFQTPTENQGMGGDFPKFARFGRETSRAYSGCARTSPRGRAQHRRSRTIG
ncbi:MAG: hypothetical protein DME72_08125 [Verrucomicrobia bacterium]|nr:MAG: hypothetical protein DME72_08125 [Verrucomicrobiota bacterium]